MRVVRCVERVVCLVMLVALAACGGGGGGAAAPTGTKMGGAVQGIQLALANSVTTFAGLVGSTDGTGAAARFNFPSDIATDGTNLYVADTANSTVRQIVIATGVTTTLVGTAGVTGATDATGAAAKFNHPSGIVISPDKATLYLADSGNNNIRQIAIASRAVTTVAGTAGVIGSADGTGAAASFNSPTGIATDGTNLYVADSLNNAVRQIVIASGAVSTLAGSVLPGFTDGTGAAAAFNSPYGITASAGSLYLTDKGNSAIRKIDIATGAVTTPAGPDKGILTPSGITTTDGTNFFVTNTDSHVVHKVVIDTQAVTVTILAGDAVTFLPGTSNGTGGSARFDDPLGITNDGTNLYVADAENGLIRKIVIASGVVTTIAGTPGGADGIGTAAGFQSPSGLTTDGINVYALDTENCTIRKIVIATQAVTTVAGTEEIIGSADGTGLSARFNFPNGLTMDATNLYVADTGNNTIRKVVIDTGVVTTLAGTAGVTGSADGTGAAASFNAPGGITTDGTNLYVTDTGNNTIRKIVIATGAVTTLAGTAGVTGAADGVGPAAGFNSPFGITTDGTSIFVADAANNAIRKISIATGAVSTMVLTGATLSFPIGVTTDGTSLYVADSGNQAIRKIVIATGATTSVATSGFSDPNGITTDGRSLYVSDSLDNDIAQIN